MGEDGVRAGAALRGARKDAREVSRSVSATDRRNVASVGRSATGLAIAEQHGGQVAYEVLAADLVVDAEFSAIGAGHLFHQVVACHGVHLLGAEADCDGGL